MPKREIQKWVNALRSGEYKQGRRALQGSDGFCCLGVACDLFIPKEKLRMDDFNEHKMAGGVPMDQNACPDWLKKINCDFEIKTCYALTQLNDKGPFADDSLERVPFTFDEIADVVEAVYIHEVLE